MPDAALGSKRKAGGFIRGRPRKFPVSWLATTATWSRRFPQLKWKYSTWLTPDDELESFRAAFAFICSLTKTEKPVTRYALSWWIDTGRQWCQPRCFVR